MISTLIVLAKQPLPGQVKTRLTPALTADEAALLAGAALRDTLRAAENVPASQRILSFDGDPNGWLPSDWGSTVQPCGTLDVRLAGAFAAAGRGTAVLVGMDTPQLRPEHLSAYDDARYDACLGQCPDGGYWVIGFRDPGVAARAIVGVPMSCSDTGAQQYERLLRLGLRVQLLQPLTDVDTIEDAVEVAALIPDSEFARCLSDIRMITPAGSSRH